MTWPEFFLRVVATLNGLAVFLIAVFMTFVASTQDVYPWRKSWPYVAFTWAMCAFLFWMGLGQH